MLHHGSPSELRCRRYHWPAAARFQFKAQAEVDLAGDNACIVSSKDPGALEDMLEFAHVAGPVVLRPALAIAVASTRFTGSLRPIFSRKWATSNGRSSM